MKSVQYIGVKQFYKFHESVQLMDTERSCTGFSKGEQVWLQFVYIS